VGDLLRHGWIEIFHGTTPWVPANAANRQTQETGVADHPKAFHRVGLLANEPPNRAGLLFI